MKYIAVTSFVCRTNPVYPSLNMRMSIARTWVLFVLLPLSALATAADDTEYLDCLIEPWIVSDVGSPVQGVVQKVLVDRGDSVAKGQPLAQLESGVEGAEVALASARASAQSEIIAREAELRLAELESARIEDLYRQKLITEQQRDESEARLRIAHAALEQARENTRSQELELARIQREYARRIITSPFDGVVVNVTTSSGEFVYDNPLMTVAALDQLRVDVMLPARLFGTIAKGDTAAVYPELQQNEPIMSTVDVVDATLDSRSGTFGVRLSVLNPSRDITAGQRCQIKFEPEAAAALPGDGGNAAETDMPQ